VIFRGAQALLLTAGGAAALLLFVWNAPVLAIGIIFIAALAWLGSATGDRRPATSTAVIVLLAILHAIAGTRPRLYDWTDWLITRRDYFFIWGYKARLFFVEHGIPWHFLQRLPSDFSHPDYPLLVPLLFDVPAVLTSRFDPRMFGVIQTLLGAALLVIAHQCLRDELPPLHAALGAIALSGAALLPWFGFADPILVAFAASGALLIRRYLRGHSAALGPAIAFLAFAAMSKNEGIAFFVAVCLAAPTVARKLWPAAAVIAAWFCVRLALHLHTDVFTGSFLSRIAHNVAMFPRAFANIPTYGSLLVVAALIAIALAPAENLRRERFLLTVVVIQIAFYLAAYAITPLDVIGHVNGSWDRISSHVTLLIGFAGVTSLRRS
jgi:hypothetical protein